MPKNKQLPINRSNKFFSGDDFDLEIDFGREWLEGDINIKVILFQVDRQKTNTDDVYGEAPKNGIMFKPPVELSVNFKNDIVENIEETEGEPLGGENVRIVPVPIELF